MIDPWHRAKLAAMCLDKGKRINGGNFQVPSRWWPHRVKHPDTFRVCTEDQAWELISDALTNGTAVKVEPYYKAHRIDCCVMLVDGCDGKKIYIKIAHIAHADKIVGASFHISDRP